jgi:hypothetical protein
MDRLDSEGDCPARGGPYVLVAVGPDGRLRSERFTDVGAYRARIAGITSADRTVSFDDLVKMLED